MLSASLIQLEYASKQWKSTFSYYEETEEEDPAQALRPSRSSSGRPPPTAMRVPLIQVRTSQGRKRSLLLLLVQSSSRPRVLVLSHPAVPLPPQVGEVDWQEAWVRGWLRLEDRRRSKSRLTHVFLSLFAVMYARRIAHSPSTQMQLYAHNGLYIFAELLFQCLHVVHFVSCLCCLLYTIVSATLSAQGLAH